MATSIMVTFTWIASLALEHTSIKMVLLTSVVGTWTSNMALALTIGLMETDTLVNSTQAYDMGTDHIIGLMAAVTLGNSTQTLIMDLERSSRSSTTKSPTHTQAYGMRMYLMIATLAVRSFSVPFVTSRSVTSAYLYTLHARQSKLGLMNHQLS